MKKNVFAAFAAVLFCISAQAQIAKGSVFAGLDLNVGSQTNQNIYSPITARNNKFTQTDFSFTPGVGYFVAEDFVIGINVGYSMTKTSNSTGDPLAIVSTTNSNGLAFTPYGRYYFNLGEKAAFFTQLNIGYTKTWGGSESFSSGVSNYKDTNTGYIFGASFMPGLSYFISDKFELEAGIGLLGYTMTSSTSAPTTNTSDTQTVKNSNFGLNLTMSAISFGFKYYLHKA
jgi:outer membrane protein